jgi:hypothetical protein
MGALLFAQRALSTPAVELNLEFATMLQILS